MPAVVNACLGVLCFYSAGKGVQAVTSNMLHHAAYKQQLVHGCFPAVPGKGNEAAPGMHQSLKSMSVSYSWLPLLLLRRILRQLICRLGAQAVRAASL